MEVKIIVSHRLGINAEIVDNPIYLNVRAGAALSDDGHDTLQGDNTGENISGRANSLCEYTPLYWAWKNIDADYYGLCHYRRYISFAEKDLKFGKYLKQAMINSLSKANQHLLHIDDEDYMKSVISQYDMIVPYEYDSFADWVGDKQMTVKEQWLHINKDFLKAQDFDVLLQLIKKHSPQYYEPMLKFMDGHKFRGFNCFVMKKNLFNEFCEFAFPILLEFDDMLDKEELSEYQMRAPGFAGEWLFSLWTHIKQNDNSVKALQKQLVYVCDTNKQKLLTPKFGKDIPAFVYTENLNNIPKIAVSIESLISSKRGMDKLDIIILHRSYDPESWEWHTLEDNNKLLLEMVKERKDISLRFYNPKNEIGKFNLASFLKKSDEEECYKALLPWILSEYDKAVLMSENVMFRESPVDWYKNLIDGMYDGWGCTRNLKEINNRENLEKPEYDLIVCDLEKIRAAYKKSEVTECLVTNNCYDAFVEKCYPKSKSFIDNNGIFRDEYDHTFIKNGIPAKYYRLIPKYDDAYVVKVMDAGDIDLTHGTRTEKYYWNLALKTSFYNDLLSDWMDRRYSQTWISKKLRNACNISPYDSRTDDQILADTFFPHGTVRREVINKIIPKGSKVREGLKNKAKDIVKR